MSADWLALLDGPAYTWELRNPGATEEELERLAAFFGRLLPDDYAAFLRMSNGAILSYDDEWYMRLWTSSDIPSWSAAYGFVPSAIPGAIAFGDDGGGEGLVFDVRPERPDGRYPIFLVNFVTIGWKDAIHVADDFRGLVSLKQGLFHEVTKRHDNAL